MLEIYLDGYSKNSANKRKLGNKYSFGNLVLYDYDYFSWYEELDDVTSILPVEGDKEEVKEETRIQILTSDKLFPIRSILLA